MSRACPTCSRSYPDAVFFCGQDGTITVEEQDPADFDPRLGKQLGGYIVVARVADGAMGRVFEGRHPETKARVAIKVLHDRVARDSVATERFKREYETAKEMTHPNVVKVLEFGETPDSSFFLTMEYLQGNELSGLLADKKPLSKERIVRIVCQVASALDHAHSFGFIHRDLKPDNIFVCETAAGPEVRVLDFGSVKLQMETGAKLTAIGTTLGSPYYMSPEQAMGAADVDQRSDVFALGAILYEMITCKIAFEGNNIAMILMKIMNEQPAPASSINRESPVSVDDVIDKAIRKDKKTRYAGTKQLADALIAAYGLKGEMDEWAKKPEKEIAEALAQATPAAPKPFGASLHPPHEAAAPAAGSSKQKKPAASPEPAADYEQGARASALSEAPVIPGRQAATGKMIVGIAIGVAVLGLVALLLR